MVGRPGRRRWGARRRLAAPIGSGPGGADPRRGAGRATGSSERVRRPGSRQWGATAGSRGGNRTAGGHLRVLRLQIAHERRVRRAADDSVELPAVVRDEAHARDRDIVDYPPGADLVEAIVHRDLRAAPRHDLGADGGELAIHVLAQVHDLLARVVLEPSDVRLAQELLEHRHELRLLLRGALAPVQRQRAAGHFLEVEEPVGDPLNLEAPLVMGDRRGELAILDDLQDLLGGLLHDLGRAYSGWAPPLAASRSHMASAFCMIPSGGPVDPAAPRPQERAWPMPGRMPARGRIHGLRRIAR